MRFNPRVDLCSDCGGFDPVRCKECRKYVIEMDREETKISQNSEEEKDITYTLADYESD